MNMGCCAGGGGIISDGYGVLCGGGACWWIDLQWYFFFTSPLQIYLRLHHYIPKYILRQGDAKKVLILILSHQIFLKYYKNNEKLCTSSVCAEFQAPVNTFFWITLYKFTLAGCKAYIQLSCQVSAVYSSIEGFTIF